MNVAGDMREVIVKKTMLEYCKIILWKISFNRKLFLKEYRKSFTYLNEAERMQLKSWIRNHRNVMLGEKS